MVTRGTGRITRLAVVWTVFGAVLATGCSSAGMSRQDEIRLGQEAAAKIEQQHRTRTDARVNRIGQAVAARSKTPSLPYRFRVIAQNEPNAFALPGGPVYVTEGLLRMVGSDDDQLAGVLGHEIAHITERHSIRQLERQNILGSVIGILTEGSTQKVAQVLAGLESLSYSRSQERDSDTKGARYARAAGYDPMGLVRFLEQLAKLQRGGSSLSFLRTHPGSEARAARLRDQLRQAKG